MDLFYIQLVRHHGNMKAAVTTTAVSPRSFKVFILYAVVRDMNEGILIVSGCDFSIRGLEYFL